MASIFTKIINREIPANVLAEDDRFIAFLDINPLSVGHALVVPKKEVDYFFDVDDDSEDLGEAHLGISLLKSLQEREPARRWIVWLSR